MSFLSRSVLVFCAFGAVVSAAPMLRLSNAALGPIYVATGQNGPTQTVNASNAGDGTLSLSASANVSWIGASVSGSAVQIALNTSSLARGVYTGTVTVSAPNAVDAPQTITVTVQVGSAVPDSMDLYLPPGGSASQTVTGGRNISTSVKSPNGGVTLSVAAIGGGSFSFTSSYQVTSSAPAGTGDGDYSGSFTMTGSAIPGDNKTVPVTSHVTSQPIAAVSPASLTFRIAQGAAKQTQYVVLNNMGLGSLTVSGVSGNPSWLTASVQTPYVAFTADPTGMNPGSYTATVTVTSNARNSPTSIPIEMDVLTPGPAWTYFQRNIGTGPTGPTFAPGVVDNVLFTSNTLSPGEWTALFGEQLTTGSAQLQSGAPYSTNFGGATVFVNNQPAPIYYVSPTQIDFLIPFATPSGPAVVRVDRDGQTGNSVSVNIVPTAPVLLRIGSGTYADYANAVIADPAGPFFPIPANAGLVYPSRPAVAGQDIILFYAFGLGQTSPPASDGQAATATQVNPTPTVIIGESTLPGTGLPVVPDYAGLTPTFVGLYQINVRIPASSPRGNAIPVYLNQNGSISNRVNIAIQ